MKELTQVKETILNAAQNTEKLGAIVAKKSAFLTLYRVAPYYITAYQKKLHQTCSFDGIRYGYRAEDMTTTLEIYV